MASTFFALNGLVGCGHMYGLIARRICPLDLMKSDDRNPFRFAEVDVMLATRTRQFVRKRTGLSPNRTSLRPRRPRNPGHGKIATPDWGGKTAGKLLKSDVSRSHRRCPLAQRPELPAFLLRRQSVWNSGGRIRTSAWRNQNPLPYSETFFQAGLCTLLEVFFLNRTILSKP
jgi:hypothetical protein